MRLQAAAALLNLSDPTQPSRVVKRQQKASQDAAIASKKARTVTKAAAPKVIFAKQTLNV